MRWGESPSHPWRVGFGDATTVDADMHACGQTYLDLYAVDPQPVRIAQLDESIRHLIDSGNTAAWTWIDAIQMAMPVFARLGVLRKDPSYFEAMWKLYSHTRDVEGGGLFDEKTGLWWRDSSFNPGEPYTRSPNGIDVYWSRGNGWVLAALARVLEVLPADEPHRPALESDFRALAAALLPLQRQDGFWNSSLADPNHCAAAGEAGEDGPETSGTALFAYGFAWGTRQGLLDIETYGPPLVAAWNGLTRVAVRSDGFLGWVQSTGAAPCSSSGPLGADAVPDFEDYGVGCFLLAGSEVLRLRQQPTPESATTAGAAGAPSAPTDLSVGDRTRPMNVEGVPLFGWLPQDGPNELQSAYEISVARTRDGVVVWNSGKVASSEQAYVPYGGPPLAGQTSYSWSVRTWDHAALATYVAGLGMQQGPMTAHWLLRALSDADRIDDVVARLTDTAGPGFGNVLANGGTVTWESWAPTGSESESHGWGAEVLVDFMETLLGVRVTSPGAATIAIVLPRTSLGAARGSVPTQRGPVRVDWRRAANGALTVAVDVPVNVRALVSLPVSASSTHSGSGEGAPVLRGVEAGRAQYESGSGRSELTVRPL